MGQSKWALACTLAACVLAGAAIADDPAAEDAFGEAASGEAGGSSAAPDNVQSASPTDLERLAEQRIERVLDRPLKSPLDFIDTPLNTILGILAEEYEIPIQFDKAALEGVGMAADVELSIMVRGVTLRSALDLILQNTGDLTYIVDDEVLLITTKDEAQSRLEVRVYRVDDLLEMTRTEQPKGGSTSDYNPLVGVITECVSPDSWMDNGTGEGVIRYLPPGVLAIYQTNAIHREVENLLAAIRSVKAAINGEVPTAITAVSGETR